MSSPRKPTVVSLFAGCGGSSLGYKLAGYKCLLAVEWDGNAVETYRANFPKTDVYHGDIGQLEISEILDRTGLKVGTLDVLDGSPPCQGFSIAGRRQFDDDRNQLFREYVRILQGLQPKVFVMENVYGMVQGKMKLIFAEALRMLKDSGYEVSARVMNAMYYGVPQSRRRIIFIGVRKDLGIKPSHPRPASRPTLAGEALADLPLVETVTSSPEVIKLWNLLKPGQSFEKAHPKGHWFNKIKLDPNKPSPTITKGLNNLYHWQLPRPLTVLELKRLGSFPDDFIFPGTKSQQWGRIGNAVPPLLMKAIAGHIKAEILSKID